MKFVAGGLNGEFLLKIADNATRKTKKVYAAVAYASSDPRLFQICRNVGIQLKFWCRYDASVPITTPILKKFLEMKSLSYECKLVPDIFHPKVIWWHDYGAYIGSANLTEQGWFGNIEAGLFLDKYDIIENDLEGELNSFFEEIDRRAFPLTEEIYQELCTLEKERSQIHVLEKDNRERFIRSRKIPHLPPLTRHDKKPAAERNRNRFILEWNDTLQLLRNIAERVSADEYRPVWVNNNIPNGVQVDQFLHAFYYAQVRTGTRALHHEFHEENKENPEKALVKAMDWWKLLEEPPSYEDRMMNEWAPFLYEKLHSDNLLNLTKGEFIEVCSRIHAMKDHSLRIKYSAFGLKDRLPSMNSDERIKYFGEWLYSQKSSDNRNALETINFVLYGGIHDKLSDRLWESVTNDKWFIPHLGVSSLGEMTGWAMPDIFPPRNGRTSKALFALGNKVRIHSE